MPGIIRSAFRVSCSRFSQRAMTPVCCHLPIGTPVPNSKRFVHAYSALFARDRPPPDYPLLIPGVKVTGPRDEEQYGKLVYVGSLLRQIYTTKFISLSSTILGLAAQPYLYQEFQNWPMIPAAVITIFGGFFVYVTPFLLHFMTKKYVLRMYYDRETQNFTAMTLGLLPIRKYLIFKAGDVHVPKVTSALAVIAVRLPGRREVPLFMNPPDFMDQDAYSKLMGYDRPVVLRSKEEKGGKSRD